MLTHTQHALHQALFAHLKTRTGGLPRIQRTGAGIRAIPSGPFFRGIAFACLLLAVSTSYPLRADSAYAYSENDVTAIFGNATAVGKVTTRALNSSSYSGNGSITHTGPLDPKQTYVGPTTPPPGQNSFGPFGMKGPGYSRADTEIEGTTIGALDGQNVAEAYRTTPGSASDLAFDGFEFGITPTVADQPISIEVFANPNMQVATTGDGTAQANIYLSVTISDHATGATLLTWAPNGTLDDFTLVGGGAVSAQEDPYSLNTGINCSGTCSKSYAPGFNSWDLSYEGAAGEQYDVLVRWSETVSVTIPEPASLGLTGGALIFFGLVLKRRRRTQDLLTGNDPRRAGGSLNSF